MKIGLLTIHYATSYGAVLQAYALQKVLSQYGETEIIDYKTNYMAKTMQPVRFATFPQGLLSTIKDYCHLARRKSMIDKFLAFTNKMPLTKTFHSTQELMELNDYFDIFVCGSDQIWNPMIVNGNDNIDENYFLHFVKSKPTISYAASMGTYRYEGENLKKLQFLLSNFTKISVRESNTKKELEALLTQEISQDIDPTLLLDKNDWCNEFDLQPLLSTDKYLLAFTFKVDSLSKYAVSMLSKQLGLPVVELHIDLLARYGRSVFINDAGPVDFLKLIGNAAFVVTNSFHGVAFSIIFSKEFIVTPPLTGHNRISDLLSKLNLSDRFLLNPSQLDSVVSQKINYSEILPALNKLRVESNDHLSMVLNNLAR